VTSSNERFKKNGFANEGENQFAQLKMKAQIALLLLTFGTFCTFASKICWQECEESEKYK